MAFAFALFAGGRTALADPSLADRTAAETLFSEGRKQLTQGRTAEACKSFSESQRLDPGVGTLLNLAVCYEKLGKLASAWTIYREAAAAAKSAGQKAREQIARRGADALEPRLAKLTIVSIDGDKTLGLQIVRDGEPIPVTLLGVAAAIDPGPHQLEASAPGRQKWTEQINAEAGVSISVTIPALTAEPPSPPPQRASDNAAASPPRKSTEPADTGSTPSAGNTQRIIAGVAAGAGVVATAVGGYFGGRALSTYDGADCTPNNVCSQSGLDAQERAHSYGRTATIAITGGLVAIAAGVVLWVTAPTPPARATSAGALDKRRVWVTAEPLGEVRSLTISGKF